MKPVIYKNVKIGKGTTVEEFVKIGSKHEGTTRIGENCIIRSHTVIYNDVTLGEGTQTGHHVLIREKTRIGKKCKIGTGTIIDGHTTIGNNVSIQSGVYIPLNTVIEDDVFLGPCCVLTNDKYPPSPKLEGAVIKRGASIGANAIILPGVVIGESAAVGAGAVVTKNVPAGTVVIGIPAKFYCMRKELK